MPPDKSTRQTILEAFVGRLEGIQVATGSTGDLGHHVFVGETPTLGENDEPYALAVVLQPERQEWQGKKVWTVLPVEVQVLVPVGESAWKANEAGIADVKRALEVDHDLGGLLDAHFPMKRGPVLPYVRESGGQTTGATLTYELTFQEGWGTP